MTEYFGYCDVHAIKNNKIYTKRKWQKMFYARKYV
jgi:hypothetical protein